MEMIALLNEMAEGFEQYGEQGYYDDIQIQGCIEENSSGISTRNWNTFANCVGNGIAKSFGLDVLKKAFNKEVRQALKSRKWKVASSIMHRNLKKILGKKAASFVIKKLQRKLCQAVYLDRLLSR